MENQHRKIKGYRELSAEEIALMNEIKQAGAALLSLHKKVQDSLTVQRNQKSQDMKESDETRAEYWRFIDAEPERWAAIGKKDIQTGIMALVRAVAQPSEC